MVHSDRISMAEAGWLMMENRNRPMHVATLLIYSLPDNAEPDFLNQLVASLRDSTEFADPFNRRLARYSGLSPLPVWVKDFDLDLEYHVRHMALPHPGGERELGMLISRLHSNPLDLERPLWEYHIIEGLDNNRFAIYFKMHHSLVDGIAGVRVLQRSMSTDPKDVNTPALWSAGLPHSEKANTAESVLSRAKKLGKAVLEGADSVNSVASRLGDVAKAAMDEDDPLVLPFQTPVSILNHRIHSQRRFATQQYEFDRIKSLAKAGGCTVNDIVLSLCSGALRRFLKEVCALPGRSLTAGIPVSMRTSDDNGAGAAVAFIVATLGTNIADPVRRLEAIKASTSRAKGLMSGMSRASIENFTNALLTPNTVLTMTNMEGRVRPVFNLTISNVPGPAEHLYLRGARLEAMYPVSIVTHGQALNITCYSYAGTLSFGFAACRDTLPRMQRLAVFTGEALEELETALGTNKQPAPARSRSRKKG